MTIKEKKQDFNTIKVLLIIWFILNFLLVLSESINFMWLKPTCFINMQCVWHLMCILKLCGQFIYRAKSSFYFGPGMLECATRGGGRSEAGHCFHILFSFFFFLLLLRLLLFTHFGESPVRENLFPPIFWHN